MHKLSNKDIQYAIAPTNLIHPESLINHESLSGAIENVNKAQLHGLELSGNFPQDPMLLHARLRSSGIQVSGSQFCSHFTNEQRFTESINAFIDKMHFLNAINASHVIVCEMGRSVFSTDTALFQDNPKWTQKEWKLLAEGLRRIGDIATQNKMEVVYQPHIGTGVKTAEDIEKLFGLIHQSPIGLLIDTGQLTVLGIPPKKIIKDYADKIKCVYISDIKKSVLSKAKRLNTSYQAAIEAGLFTLPGSGDINFDPILLALKHAEFNGWVVLHGEQEHARTDFSARLKGFRKYLKSILGT